MLNLFFIQAPLKPLKIKIYILTPINLFLYKFMKLLENKFSYIILVNK